MTGPPQVDGPCTGGRVVHCEALARTSSPKIGANCPRRCSEQSASTTRPAPHHPRDLVVVEAEHFLEHLIGVLAEARRRGAGTVVAASDLVGVAFVGDDPHL